MDDFVTALLFLPFLILPLIVLIAIISSKIKAAGVVKNICVATKETSTEASEIHPPTATTDVTAKRGGGSSLRVRQRSKCGAI
jgi:hypothetical protein